VPSAPDPTADLIDHLARRDLARAIAACDNITGAVNRLEKLVTQAQAELAEWQRELEAMCERADRP
jgi:Skp family chaperone for outer membrane proteins